MSGISKVDPCGFRALCPECEWNVGVTEVPTYTDCPECNTKFIIRGVPMDDLREFVDRIEEERVKLLENDAATESGKAHRNGVACGMDYFKDELEDLIDE